MLCRDFEGACVKLFEELFPPPGMPLEEFDATTGTQIGAEEFELGKVNVFSAMSLISRLAVGAFLPDLNPTSVLFVLSSEASSAEIPEKFAADVERFFDGSEEFRTVE
jgi:hypothetical protein